MTVKKRLAVARVYSRALTLLFERVACALANVGLDSIKYQIIRNYLLPCNKSLVGQYRALRALHTTLLSTP